ncbi:hypothetical protein TNCV_2338371 [Trichonephila clavipes]|nr:hypothetical protein TNCV_2338371 [Trichonephila clavipes]
MTPVLAPRSPNYHTNGRTFELLTNLMCIATLHGGSSVVLGPNGVSAKMLQTSRRGRGQQDDSKYIGNAGSEMLS